MRKTKTKMKWSGIEMKEELVCVRGPAFAVFALHSHCVMLDLFCSRLLPSSSIPQLFIWRSFVILTLYCVASYFIHRQRELYQAIAVFILTHSAGYHDEGRKKKYCNASSYHLYDWTFYIWRQIAWLVSCILLSSFLVAWMRSSVALHHSCISYDMWSKSGK